MERLDKSVSIKFSTINKIREPRLVDIISPPKLKGKIVTLTSSGLKEKEIGGSDSQSNASSVDVLDMLKTANK